VAGLLTLPTSEGLPVLKTVAIDFQKLYSSFEEKELQQRELLRIFTLFPFNVIFFIKSQPKFCTANVLEFFLLRN
jgi:hypothetical protein